MWAISYLWRRRRIHLWLGCWSLLLGELKKVANCGSSGVGGLPQRIVPVNLRGFEPYYREGSEANKGEAAESVGVDIHEQIERDARSIRSWGHKTSSGAVSCYWQRGSNYGLRRRSGLPSGNRGSRDCTDEGSLNLGVEELLDSKGYS